MKKSTSVIFVDRLTTFLRHFVAQEETHGIFPGCRERAKEARRNKSSRTTYVELRLDIVAATQ